MQVTRIIQILVSVTLLAILFYWIDLTQLSGVLLNANLLLLGVALLITTANRVLMAVKWNLLLKTNGIRLSCYEVTKIYYTSTFLGLFLPPTVGGDAVRAYQVSKRGCDLSDVVSSILIERILGMITLFLFGIVGCVLLFTSYRFIKFDTSTLLWTLIAFASLAVGAFIMSLSKNFGKVVFDILSGFQQTQYVARLSGALEQVYRSYQSYNGDKASLVIFFGLTCLENVLPIIRPFVISMALYAYVPFTYLVVIVPIELILIRLPISFDGFGIREGLFVFFLGLLGMSKDVAFSIGLTNHMVFLVALTPGAVFYLLSRDFGAGGVKVA